MGSVKRIFNRVFHRHEAPAAPQVLRPPSDLFVLSPAPLRPVPGMSGLSVNPTPPGPSVPVPTPDSATSPRKIEAANAPVSMLADPINENVAVRPWYARAAMAAAAPNVITAPHLQAANQPAGVGGALTIPTAGGDLGLGGLADAAAGTGTLGYIAGHATLAGGAVIGDGFASLSGGAVVAEGSTLQVANVAVFGWDDYLGLAGSWAEVNPSTQQFLLVGASVSASANRTARHLGVYEAPDAGAIAAAQNARGPLHRLQFVWRRGAAASLRAGGGHLLFGGQIRVGYSRAREITYTRFADRKTARQAVFDGHGFRHFCRSKARALGWTRDPWAPPAITAPETLALGDEMRLATSGTWIASGVAGNLGAWVGAQYVYKGDVEIIVRKVSEHHVELITTPTKVHSIAALVGSAIGLQATVERPTARALRQAFVFDLREPAAVAAYKEAVAGKAPGALHKAKIRGAAALHEIVQREAGHLPIGVRRTFAQVMRTTQVRAGGGFHFYIIPRFMLPRGWEPGLMKHRISTTEKRWTSQGGALFDAKVKGVEHRSELGWRGLRSDQVTTAISQSTAGDGATTKEMLFSARISRSHSDGPRINRTLLAPLSEAFRLDLGKVHGSKKRTKEVEVRFQIPLDALNHLEASPMYPGMAGPNSTRRYKNKMSRVQTAEKRAAITQKFVQKHGLAGAATLWRMAGCPSLNVGTSDPVYADALERAQKVRLLHACRHGTHCAKGYNGPKAVKKGIDLLDLGLRRIGDESLLPEANKRRLNEDLARERRALMALPH